MEIPESAIYGQIKRGVILHSDMFEGIDHGKFFAVMGVSKDFIAGFFFINSNIHRSLFGKKEQLNMQYPLKKSDYDFLKYDSFLCASSIITRHKNHICESILCGGTKFVGNLKKEHIEEVLQMARESRLFSKKDKQDFFY